MGGNIELISFFSTVYSILLTKEALFLQFLGVTCLSSKSYPLKICEMFKVCNDVYLAEN